MMKNVAAVILAAGKGTRINAKETNKVLYPLAGKPMIGYTLETLENLGISSIVIVVGFKKEKVVEYLGRGYRYVDQEKLLGTGHALKRALGSIPRAARQVLVMNGDDSAFYTKQTLQHLIDHHRKTSADITLLTTKTSDPGGYGRILRDKDNTILGIREEAVATAREKEIKEINTGTYCFSFPFLKQHLSQLTKDPQKGEYYLTDIIELGVKNGRKVESIRLSRMSDFVGVNTREELLEAERVMQKRKKN